MMEPMSNPETLFAVAKEFITDPKSLAVEKFGRGSIHDTFKLEAVLADGARKDYLLQLLNTNCFQDPLALANNYRLLALAFRDVDYRHKLSAVTDQQGELLHLDGQGRYWRMFEFIDQSYSCARFDNVYQAYEVARIFGEFLRRLDCLPSQEFQCVFADFHDSTKHYQKMLLAASADLFKRLPGCLSEYEYLTEQSGRLDMMCRAMRRLTPQRLTHNDTGVDNALMDSRSHGALCAVDWDTVMIGYSVIDFGDLLRASIKPEVIGDRPLVDLFEALARGYVAGAGGILTDEEIRLFVCGGQIISLELACRYLADYLLGDPIFRGRNDSSVISCRKALAGYSRLCEHQSELEAILADVIDS